MNADRVAATLLRGTTHTPIVLDPCLIILMDLLDISEKCFARGMTTGKHTL
jgi:hypothetical protein